MSQPSLGPIGQLRNISATMLRGLHTRAQLMQVELQEERDRLLRRITLMLAMVLFGAFGLLFVVVCLMTLLPPHWRAGVAGVAALLFLGSALYSFGAIRREKRTRNPVLGTSLSVLAGDVEALSGHAPLATDQRMAGARP